MADQTCWNPSCSNQQPRKLLKCSRCQVAKYCGLECQKKHWKSHKKTCRQPEATTAAPSFLWETAPDPPENSPERHALQWMHPEWHKMCGMVLTLAVREAFYECQGFWPTLPAPDLLDEGDFQKFCYYAATMSEQQRSKAPKGYIPMDYIHKPEAWRARRKQEKENAKRFRERFGGTGLFAEFAEDLGTDTSSDEESDHDHKPAAVAAQPVIKKQKRVSPATKKKKSGSEGAAAGAEDQRPTLLDFDNEIRGRIADYLLPHEWQDLRLLCRCFLTWPKPPPTFDCQIIVFCVTNQFDTGWIGVAKTPQDVKEAALHVWNNLNNYHTHELGISMKFVDFDVSKRALPIMSFPESEYYESCGSLLEPHELAKDFLGVVTLNLPYEYQESSIWAGRWHDDDYESDDGPFPGCQLGCLIEWFGGHKPKREIDLLHFGVRRTSCTYCGEWTDCLCELRGITCGDRIGGPEGRQRDIWYSPKWWGLPPAEDSPIQASNEGMEEKTWVIFDDEVSLWDTC